MVIANELPKYRLFEILTFKYKVKVIEYNVAVYVAGWQFISGKMAVMPLKPLCADT